MRLPLLWVFSLLTLTSCLHLSQSSPPTPSTTTITFEHIPSFSIKSLHRRQVTLTSTTIRDDPRAAPSDRPPVAPFSVPSANKDADSPSVTPIPIAPGGTSTSNSTLNIDFQDDISDIDEPIPDSILDPDDPAGTTTATAVPLDPITESGTDDGVLNRMHFLWLLFCPLIIAALIFTFIVFRRRRRASLCASKDTEASRPAGSPTLDFSASRFDAPPPYSQHTSTTALTPPPVPPPRIARPGGLLRRFSGNTIETFREPPPVYRNGGMDGSAVSEDGEEEEIAMTPLRPAPRSQGATAVRVVRGAPDVALRRPGVPFPVMEMPVLRR